MKSLTFTFTTPELATKFKEQASSYYGINTTATPAANAIVVETRLDYITLAPLAKVYKASEVPST